MAATEHVSLVGPSEATLRALKRVADGDRPTHAAKAEGINPSTLFRALAKRRPHKRYLVIDKHPDRFDAWIENERYKQLTDDVTFASVEDLQLGLPELLDKC